MFIVPVLLGDGVRLFESPGGTIVRLVTRSVTTVPNATMIWLDVVR